MRRIAIIIALVTVAGRAHADRYTRGQLVYQEACVRCHNVGWTGSAAPEKGRVDLSRVIERLGEGELRRFIESPSEVRKGTPCKHQMLGHDQIEDVIAFFRARAGSPPQTVRIPPRSQHPQAKPRPTTPSKTMSATPSAAMPGALSATPSSALKAGGK